MKLFCTLRSGIFRAALGLLSQAVSTLQVAPPCSRFNDCETHKQNKWKKICEVCQHGRFREGLALDTAKWKNKPPCQASPSTTAQARKFLHLMRSVEPDFILVFCRSEMSSQVQEFWCPSQSVDPTRQQSYFFYTWQILHWASDWHNRVCQWDGLRRKILLLLSLHLVTFATTSRDQLHRRPKEAGGLLYKRPATWSLCQDLWPHRSQSMQHTHHGSPKSLIFRGQVGNLVSSECLSFVIR